VPAAAVIPAPIAYIKVVAVEKLVVEPGPFSWLSPVSVCGCCCACASSEVSRGRPVGSAGEGGHLRVVCFLSLLSRRRAAGERSRHF